MSRILVARCHCGSAVAVEFCETSMDMAKFQKEFSGYMVEVEEKFLPPERCTCKEKVAERDALKAEVDRLKRDYAIFEELAPPDMPRAEFARWCFDAFDNGMAREQELKAEVEWLRTALEKISTWRTSCHDYDVDMGHELREFDAETVEAIEVFARAALGDAQAAIGRGHAESQPVDRVTFDRTLAGLPLLNLQMPMPPVKKPR